MISGIREHNFAIISKHELWEKGVDFPGFIDSLLIFFISKKKKKKWLKIARGKRKDFVKLVH